MRRRRWWVVLAIMSVLWKVVEGCSLRIFESPCSIALVHVQCTVYTFHWKMNSKMSPTNVRREPVPTCGVTHILQPKHGKPLGIVHLPATILAPVSSLSPLQHHPVTGSAYLPPPGLSAIPPMLTIQHHRLPRSRGRQTSGRRPEPARSAPSASTRYITGSARGNPITQSSGSDRRRPLAGVDAADYLLDPWIANDRSLRALRER